MAFWKRFTSCVSSHASHILSRFEDPVVKTERAIELLTDLKKKSFESLAQVKALIITTEQDLDTKAKDISRMDQQVRDLLKKQKDGEVSPEQAETLALGILKAKVKVEKELKFLNDSLIKYRKLEETLETKTLKIQQQIKDCEFELTALKSRLSVAKTLKEISKSTSDLNDDSVTVLLKDTEVKVRNEEALATAYESLKEATLDEQIEDVLGSPEDAQAKEELAKLKAEI